MDELTAELAAAAWFESVRIPVMSASELAEEGQFGPGSVILTTVLSGVLRRLNPHLPHDTIEEVVRILSRPPHPTLIQNNRWLHALVTDGVEIEYRESNSGETRGDRARLVDFDNPATNDLLVLRQLRVAGASGKIIRPRPDSVPERVAGRVDRAESPDRHPGKPGRGHRPARPLHADRPRPVRVEPGAGGLGRHADPRRLDHQRAQPLHALAPDRRS